MTKVEIEGEEPIEDKKGGKERRSTKARIIQGKRRWEGARESRGRSKRRG